MRNNDNHSNPYAKAIWSNVDRDRFFLMSWRDEINDGDFVIKTITGSERKVMLKSIEKFEITKEQAHDWLKSEFAAVVDKAKSQLLNALAKDWDEPPEWSVAAKRKKRDDAADSSTMAPMNESDSIDDNTEQTDELHGWNTLLSTLDAFGALVERSISTAAESRGVQQSHADELRSLLNDSGLNAKGDTQAFFDRLQDWLSAEEAEDGLQQCANNLEELAKTIDNAANSSSNRLRSMAEAMRKRVTENDTEE